MTDQALQKDLRSNKGLLLAGGALVGIGGLMGFGGMLLISAAVVSATRRWAQQREQPPAQVARLKWQQARAAASAGAQAWRSGATAQSPSPTLASSDSGR